MGERTIGVVIEGATGRLGTTQHLRALMAIRSEGGLPLGNGDRLCPTPVLLGRDPAKLAALAASQWRPQLEHRPRCLSRRPRRSRSISTRARPAGGRARRARRSTPASTSISKSRVAETPGGCAAIWRAAPSAPASRTASCRTNCSCPGSPNCASSTTPISSAGCCRCGSISAGGCSTATPYPAQRPSWNYRKATGGGLILDMFAHWRYIFDRLLGEIKAVSCRHMTALPERRDEAGRPYDGRCRGHGLRDLRAGGRRPGAVSLVLGQPGQARRPVADPGRRHRGSAVCGLHRCFVQPLVATPRPFFDPERPQPMVFDEQWQEMPDLEPFATATAPAGSCSCGMSPRTRRSRRRFSKAPKAFSSPRPATRAIASGAGSICRYLLYSRRIALPSNCPEQPCAPSAAARPPRVGAKKCTGIVHSPKHGTLP